MVKDETKVCPVCEKLYGFIHCRITIKGKNMCLKCAIEQDEKQKGALS